MPDKRVESDLALRAASARRSRAALEAMKSTRPPTTALRCSTAFALLAIAAGSVSAQDIAAGFPKGLYRQNGQCADLGFGVPSRERKCALFLGS
ncbi:MAG: hypothetical protein MZV65_33390 [Chromatiales bacterium]|nr:hypothetical protein [Chromatiales bacterium]